MHIIVHEPWSYVLFEENGEQIVTFMVGGSVEKDFSVRLSQSEIDLQKQDRGFVERLVTRLTKNPEQLHARRLKKAVWPA